MTHAATSPAAAAAAPIYVVPHRAAASPATAPGFMAMPHRAAASPGANAFRLVSIAGQSEIEVKTDDMSDKLKDLMVQAGQDAERQIKARDSSAHAISIDFSDLRITYRDANEKLVLLTEFGPQTINDPKLVELMQRVQTLAKKTLRFATTASEGTLANRSTSGPGPLERVSDTWLKYGSKSGDDFIEKGKHIKLLKARVKADYLKRNPLPPGATPKDAETRLNRANAEADRITQREIDVIADKIRRTDCFIHSFQSRVAQALENLKHQIANLPANAPPERRAELRRQQKELEALDDKLVRVDRDAVFYAVGAWDKLDTDDANVAPGDRNAKAEFLKDFVTEDLKANVRGGLFKTDTSLDTFIHTYGFNNGALLFHDRWEFEEHAAAHDQSDRTKGSVEECIVHMMTHLATPGFDEEEGLSSLALSGDPADPVRRETLRYLEGARRDAQAYRSPPKPAPVHPRAAAFRHRGAKP